MVAQQGGQAAPDSEIDLRPGVFGVHSVHIVPLFIGNHFQGEFVVVSQKDGPLAILGNGQGRIQDVHDGKPVFHLEGHEHARHDGEIESHITFIARTKVSRGVLRPLIGFGQKHPAFKFAVHVTP